MKRFLWVALLALPFLAVSGQKASAWGLCADCGGCAGGGQGHFFPCLGIVPGPWYNYWPKGPGGGMVGPSIPHWRFPMNFQTPAPIPVGESFCSDYGGFYPSYWYGN
jgi:hypothetical protein